MKLNHGLLGIIILLLLLSLPNIYERIQVENGQNTVEMVLPVEEIEELSSSLDQSLSDMLVELRESGLSAVSVEPLSIHDLAADGQLSIYSGTYLTDLLRLQGELNRELTDGYYVTLPENEYYNNLIEENLQAETITLFETTFFHIEDTSELDLDLGYDTSTLETLQEHNVPYVLRAGNQPTVEQNQMIVEKLVNQKNTLSQGILFTRDEAIGYPTINHLQSMATDLQQTGYHFYLIEFANQSGMQTVARSTDYDFIRLHSMFLDDKPLDESVQQTIRAIKERQIRSIYFHIPMEVEPSESYAATKDYLEDVQRNLPSKFELGTAQPFETIQQSNWMIWMVIIASIIWGYLATSWLSIRWARFIVPLVIFVLVIGYLFTDRLLLLQMIAWIIAVITPAYAVINAMKLRQKYLIEKDRAINWIKILLFSIGILLIGILMIIGMLNGNAFTSGMELFRGVKLLHIFPIVIAFIGLFWNDVIDHGKLLLHKFLHAEIKYWHALIVMIIAVIGFYYISRTGNAGSVSQVEIAIRTALEELLYVRPRTKEFLIGFPFFIIGLYLLKYFPLISKLILTFSTIGFLSVINTFTHFHMPLHLSFLRTGYSLLFGFVIGYLVVLIIKTIRSYLQRRL
ncbi:DUF5693 family protein [Oceanobacillus kimchii]|uniref:DUF5693 family protein n=1 Tax=Oceanobacillus kimchii TaxID=746691 RepID=UPI0021A37671|nr:DUF5693 family protein [Oceanobacillus kimchii]MCT1576581.1 DUF5693 family protein [Oceanobacillus kimchii]MCT2134651.1 DUF5693 family protein [Oceanobacillus kimchii]